MTLLSLDSCEAVFVRNGLSVNRRKCKQLTVYRSQLCMPDTDTSFDKVDSIKILGVTITQRFKWDEHVSNVIKTASQRLYVIRCLKEIVSNTELVSIYHSLITSIFVYASPVFGRLPSKLS